MTRRALLVAATVLVAGSLSAALLLRKPPIEVLLAPSGATEAPPPKGLDGLERIDPPRPAPDFAFQDIDGTTHHLAEFAGKPVLLNLWATWCVPCVAELPSLAALRPRAEAAGWAVLPLSVDRGGTVRVRAFFASHGVSGLPVWNDAADAAPQAFSVRGIPTTFVLDARGRQVAKLEGAADWNAVGVLERLGALVE